MKYLIIVLLLIFSIDSFAGHYVHGYTRKNDKYVSPHYTRDPGEATHSYSYRKHSSTGSHSKRDPAKRREFMKIHPCPSTGKTSGACPGYVVDHNQALKHGGADDPKF